MIRTTKTNKKVTAILTGDWHLQESQPVCRLDDFWETQWQKVDFIWDLQKKHNCPVIHSGDLFDHWKPSPMLLSKTIERLPYDFWTIYGNHDLPQHNFDLVHKSGIYVLEKANILNGLPGNHWGKEGGLIDVFPGNVNKRFAVWHVMTYQGQKPWPDCTDSSAAKILRKNPDFDLILTGHNHKTFVEEYQGRLLVNPGSIFRTTAAQQDHKPSVFLWYAETNTVERVFIPIQKDVISREHIEVQQERENRIDAFVSNLNTDWAAKMSFEENLEKFRQTIKLRESVMDIVYKAIEI